MQIGIDHGGDESSVLYVEASRKGVMARSMALCAALREAGRNVPPADCVQFVKNSGTVCLEDYPRIESNEGEIG